MPINNQELLKQVHFTGEADCQEFHPHPLRPSLCTDCNKLFSKHEPGAIPNDEALLQALAHSTKAEKTPDRILTTSSGGGLYLGGFRGVINTQFLREANVTHIVNTAKGLEIFGPKYLVELNWEDTETWLIPDSDIRTLCNYIQTGLDMQGQSVFVHCAQGKSRSSTAVVAYVMVAKGLSLKESLGLVQSLHKMAEPNPHFMKRLEEFEKSELLQELRQAIRI
ncbi:PREDICTED: dual specificity protein phosphatase 1B-like isoform X2 [Amphimedon queenslandica]|uniref:protein-tyrosine-phosphatase n=1 Tax=Amphimedon queenslandica TaxID=400682 RepID=A0AAN0IKY7_AMPQE|nr:PREDICTED: dual specificity protein phosphatase 1B-like isoform X2 [Amphimedon queenslandica]|eukprot:XP_011403209.2 PREDICTED: dual specificity protein phosphatase 1B-like isoform X2 [Amphimedon queenslandica]